MAAPDPVAHNVDALIDKLRSDGVEAGRAEAARLKSEAESTAAELLAAARREADSLRAQAKRDAETYEAAGREALQIAMRDAIMTMKSDLISQLEADVRRMVTSTVAEPDMLERMILELVGAAREASGIGENTEIILPASLRTGANISSDPEDIRSGALSRFALGLARDRLKDGVEFYADETLGVGLRARLADKDLTVDLSDEAIAALLMRYLQPRFRAVMDGVIR
ncbi:MAG: hypothetical protein AAFR46_07920 [Pseudomonadota bacterium]